MELENKNEVINCEMPDYMDESSSNLFSFIKDYRFYKNIFDKLISSTAVLLLSPVYLSIYLIMKLNNPKEKVFFKHKRVGKNGKNIYLYKFRSMVSNAEEVLKSNPKLYNEYVKNNYKLDSSIDPRITKLGRILRKTSLDELPQFLNVIKGDMSLIGPRPVVFEELKEYDAEKLLKVKPGVMGLWQAEGRSNVGYPKRAKIEEYYVDHCSLKFDINILIKNILIIFTGKGAY